MPPFYAAPRAALGQRRVAPTLLLPLSQIKRRPDLHHKRCCRLDRGRAVDRLPSQSEVHARFSSTTGRASDALGPSWPAEILRQLGVLPGGGSLRERLIISAAYARRSVLLDLLSPGTLAPHHGRDCPQARQRLVDDIVGQHTTALAPADASSMRSATAR
jgi:hypothetical protein